MVGHSVQNQESLSSQYICPHCSLLLRDPVQLIDCGHRLCQSCVNEQEGDTIICPECRETIPKKNLIIDRGFKNDMQTLLIVCSLCNWAGVLKIYQDHLDQTHPNPTCIYCGEKFPTVYDLDRHKQYICEKVTVDCPFKQFGCEETMLRIDLNKHYRSEQHQRVLMNIVRHLKSISSQKTIDSSHTLENTRIQLQEIDETLNILLDSIAILNTDRQRLSTESVNYQHELDSLTKDFSTLKISIQEQNAFIDQTKANQESLQQDLEPMKQKLNDTMTRSLDGTFIYKITNMKEKFATAVSETQTSIYSPPFYSSPTGYKMCLRLYLNGDGTARGTHISLFFVLMRGEYDAILKFPFNFKVIFCLYDQTNQKNHIIDAFRPDVRSNSFQRPRSEMNIASGIPKFASLKIFQQENNPYIRDDTMFIRVIIDFGDMPKAMLPYALGLNPGLTTPLQLTMIREETEKRQQQSSTSSMTNTETDQSIMVNS